MAEGLELAKAYVQIIPSAQGIQAGIEKALGGSEMAAGASAAGSMLGGLVTAGITASVAAGGKAIVDALQTGMEFDAAMSKVKAISGATGAEFDALREKALTMGASTKFTASEAAEAFQYMAMAGWKSEDMLNGIEGIMNLAAASGEDLASVSDIVTDALTAFGLQSSDAGHFADVLAAASANANTNVGLMGETFKYVAPVAGAMGYSIDDMAVAIGLMANSAVKGSSAGTALRNILTRMAAPTNDVAAAMAVLGIDLADDNGKLYSMGELLDALRHGFGSGSLSADDFSKAMAELQSAYDDGSISAEEYEQKTQKLAESMYGTQDAVEKLGLASDLAGKYGLAGLLSMVNATTEDMEKLQTAIENADGAAQEMAETMQDNLPGSITIFESALDGAKIALSDRLAPALKDFVDNATLEVQSLTETLKNEGPEAALDDLGLAAGETAAEITAVFIEHIPDAITAGVAFIEGFGAGITSEASLRRIKEALISSVKNLLKDALPKAFDLALDLLPGGEGAFIRMMISGAGTVTDWMQDWMSGVEESLSMDVPEGITWNAESSRWEMPEQQQQAGDTININVDIDEIADLDELVREAKARSRFNRMGRVVR